LFCISTVYQAREIAIGLLYFRAWRPSELILKPVPNGASQYGCLGIGSLLARPRSARVLRELAPWHMREVIVIDDDERKRITAVYSRKRAAEKNRHKEEEFLLAFPSADDFTNWWDKQFEQQRGECAYCETGIDRIRKLINAGLLRTRRVRGTGKRGTCMELERKDPFGRYEPDNCVLICMYCNNDKSNVYGFEEYKRFFGPARKAHYEWLASKLI
jgi:hypothetical protein